MVPAAPGSAYCQGCNDRTNGAANIGMDLPTPEDFAAMALAAIPDGVDPNTPTGKAKKRPSRAKTKALVLDAPDLPPPANVLEAVQRELAATMVPHPEEFMTDYSPQAGLFFLRQVAMETMRIVGAACKSLEAEGEDQAPAALEALAATMVCVTASTRGLVALDVLPAEALEAVEEALKSDT